MHKRDARLFTEGIGVDPLRARFVWKRSTQVIEGRLHRLCVDVAHELGLPSEANVASAAASPRNALRSTVPCTPCLWPRLWCCQITQSRSRKRGGAAIERIQKRSPLSSAKCAS